CCEITHLESGMSERGTSNKSRIANQKEAFVKLATRVAVWALAGLEIKADINKTVIRNYNGHRNEVHDKESGLKMPYNEVVVAGDIGEMVEARSLSMNIQDKLK
ncbi:unnamed protein product, partial [marine sediment metagenome]